MNSNSPLPNKSPFKGIATSAIPLAAIGLNAEKQSEAAMAVLFVDC